MIGLSDRNSRAYREFGLACMRKKGEDEVVELESLLGRSVGMTWTCRVEMINPTK